MRNGAAVSFAIGFIFVVSLLCAAQAGKVESVGPLTDDAVPQAVRQALDTKGYRLTLDASTPVCDLWIRKSIPAQTKKDVEGVAYPQLAESTLVAVIHFPQAAADFRGHPIPAGFYTLRYEIMPNDGNHLGAAPNRDFLLVIPAASDTDPSATFKPQELVTMSAQTAGTKHPSPLSLVQTDSGPSTPTVSKDDQDHWIFSATTKLNSGEDLPLALVVEGTAQQ
ncbi:MAG: hypothetical protein ABR881_31365 [Candidatus Sulfotelmatobacter sp.]